MHAEVSRGPALEVAKRRSAECRRHRVQLVAPCRQCTFGAQRERDVGQRGRSRPEIAQPPGQRDAVRVDGEDAGAEALEARGARVVDRSHALAGDDERPVSDRRKHLRAIEPASDCR